MEIGDIMYDIV